MDSAAVSRVIGKLYEAASTPESWSSSMNAVADALEAQSAYVLVLQRERMQADLLASAGIDPHYMGAFNQHFVQFSPCMQAAARTEVSAMGMRGAERTEFFNEFLRPQGIYWGLLGRVSVDERKVYCFGASRDRARDPFAPHELELLGILLPHLRSAFFLQQQLAAAREQRRASEAALELLGHGVLLLDQSGSLFHANRGASELLRKGDGLAVSREGKLIGNTPRDTARLQRLVRGAASEAGAPRRGGALSLPRRCASDLNLVVAPLEENAASENFASASVAVFVSDPEAPTPHLGAQARDLYGLTLAESRVVEALVQGLSPAEIAESLSVSVTTIRSQLQSIFQRTGTRGQSDLLRRLLRTPLLRD